MPLQALQSFFSGSTLLASSSSHESVMSSIYSSSSTLLSSSLITPSGWPWFFNVSSCEGYPSLTTQMPDSMDLCVWRGWFYFIALIFGLVVVSGAILTITTWILFGVLNLCKCLFGTGSRRRKGYQRIGEEPISRVLHSEYGSGDLSYSSGGDSVFTKICGASYCCLMMSVILLALCGIGFSIAFFVGLDRTSKPVYTALDSAKSALNETIVIMSNTTYTQGLTNFLLNYGTTSNVVASAIPQGQAYLTNAVVDNDDRLHLEDLIYNKLNDSMKALYEKSFKIYEITQKYDNIVKTSSIDVFQLDDVYNYTNLMPEGLVKQMLTSHSYLLEALTLTQFIVDRLNYTNNVFQGNTYSNWNSMWNEVFGPLALQAPTIPSQVGQFEDVIGNVTTPGAELYAQDVITKFEIAYMSSFIGFFVIASIVAMTGGVGVTKKSSGILTLACCCSCSVLIWLMLLAGAGIALLMAVGPYCINGDNLFNPENMNQPHSFSHSSFEYYLMKTQQDGHLALPPSTIFGNSDLFVHNYSFVVNVTRFFLNCGGQNFDQKPDEYQNVLNVIELAQQGHYATSDDYQTFFDNFIMGMESLNVTYQGNQIATSGQLLFIEMNTILNQGLPNIQAGLSSYMNALDQFKSRVNNNSNYENYEANKEEITNFQHEMTTLLDSLYDSANQTIFVEYANANDWFHTKSYPEFVQGYQLGTTFMLNLENNLEPAASSLVDAAQVVGEMLNELKVKTKCSFMVDTSTQVTNDICGIMAISTFGTVSAHLLIVFTLFAALIVGVVLSGRFKAQLLNGGIN
ncbi:hypothetical protein C9374_009987 [Naegleria lovaniensis]|uniref:Uncharacterized protein n=1 Tax=Naegleria lovaniensis TaxID=51637 RepID=A0AA88KGK4_NAELO|nr:uncharacterized protein C9374_009987 [Naegleria lovaniensis]KAG2375364.1 hypothetical protein C9374_009987 [Naegleria lovaniensis]